MENIRMKMVKKVFLFFLLISFTQISMATTYYVSSSGSDSNTGLSSSLAWQTLGKVNSATFKPGDQILFQRGNIFYGSLSINQSGTASSPITLGAYGSGANPVITGFKNVSSWTNLGGNIWESTSSVSSLSTCNMVAVNGVNTCKGRYPNADASAGGYLTVQSHTGTSSLTSSGLTGSPNWTGAEVVIQPTNWTLSKAVITAQTGGTLSYNTDITAANGVGFFIQNDSRTLDQQNEWYYNSSTKKIRIYSTSQPANVRVASIDNLVTFGNAVCYITINGIDFTGANTSALYRWAFGSLAEKVHNISILNCNISYSGGDAISICSYYLNIENNTISESNGMAINLASSRNIVVRNNSIRNTSLLPGMGACFSAIQIGQSDNTSVLIEYNNIINSGHNGISFGSDPTTIKNNFIDTFNKILHDGAGIYGGSNGKITGNIVINGSFPKGLVCGIYLDDNSTHNEVSYNTISNVSWIGLYIHNSNTNNVHHNIFYNNGTQFRVAHDYRAGPATSNTINDNQFISKTTMQPVCEFTSILNDLSSIGTFTSNYYCRPVNEGNTINTYQPSAGSVSRSLASWKTFTNQDGNSKTSPVTFTSENDFQFAYNNTKSAITITLSQPMIDVKNTRYSGSVTLQPYTSLVLMKDNNPISSSNDIVSGGVYEIVARHSGKVIGIKGASKDNYAIVDQETRSGLASQQFVITDLGTGYYKISSGGNTSKGLNVGWKSQADGADIMQYTYNGGTNEQWQFVSTGDGYFQIINRNSGKCLEVSGASLADNAIIQQYTNVHATNQEFTFSMLKSAPVEQSSENISLTPSNEKLTISIFPNPSIDGKFFVDLNSLPADENIVISIFNTQGVCLYKQDYYNNKVVEINPGLKRGMYIIKVSGKQVKVSNLLMIE